ncbi:hypothetical protein [Nocardia mexicana]|uniref:Uncharacterized protein n=1 Tax=Nocardia mexicana TaxID=279262 RepID=A0A370GN40_9NOCA|nr:hypothetical protein [Nocardia mexicana]RDI43323.1 hypothetical protein DFR68_12286 [Nocardia mexicana]
MLDVFVLVAAGLSVVAPTWLITSRTRRYRAEQAERRRAGIARHPCTVTEPPEPPVVDADLVVEWRDPARIRPALETENALLAARLAHRITAAEYRESLAELARRCEPHAESGSE